MPGFEGLGAQMFTHAITSMWNHAWNRADYRFTHQMQAAPQQVKELREAGLNPALIYGQLSPAGGEALGGDIQPPDVMNKRSERLLMDQQMKTQEALQQYYNALTYKTNEEGQMTEFNRIHQQEVYDLDFKAKGMDVVGKGIANEIAALKKTYQEYENAIRKIDLKYHDERSATELRDLVAGISLKLASAGLYKAQTETENQLRDARLREIEGNIKTMTSLRSLYAAESNLSRRRELMMRYEQALKESEWLYMKYLTNNNKDWSKLESRAKWSVYAPAIAQGINTAVNAGLMIGTHGLSGFLGNQVPQPSFWDDSGGYGPGRDHLGH